MKAIETLEISKLGIHIHFDEQDITKARAIIIGPRGTPYEDGILCNKQHIHHTLQHQHIS